VGQRCVGPCNEYVEEKEIEKTERLWSNVSSWGPGGHIPLEGEEVHIEPGWNMILDLAETPKLGLIRINGRLTFKNDMDVHLHSTHIFVRAGELIIGTKEAPYEKTGKITLHGLRNDRAIVFDNAVEAGSKLIANVGKVRMYGKKR